MEHIYQNIEGWFTFPNLYKNIVKKYSNGAHFIEVGTWLGKSATFMAVEIINSNKNIKFDCIDTWKIEGYSTIWSEQQDLIKNKSKYDLLYTKFIKNIHPVKDYINPVRMKSLEAVKLYKDNTIDFIFLDADHRYEYLSKDIEAWYPKLKSGGILAGHDYKRPWFGVIQAVNEFLKKEKYNLNIKSEDCWGILKK